MLYRACFALLLALAACAPSLPDVKAARDARYQGDTAEIFGALVEVVAATYPIKQADPARLEILTEHAAPEADGTVLAYSVVLTPTAPHRVQVLTHVQRDDGEDPAWVAARTERLILAIHERLSGYQVQVQPDPGWR
jgi:hypothetical protein